MKETTFVEQNKDKWAKFEQLSKQKNNNPDEISELFTEITEDLSYAQTFYPRRSVRVYLNQLAQGVFTSLYKQKKQPIKGFVAFWTQTVPMAVYRARKNLLMALVFFSAAIILGAVSQHFDANFVKIILGDSYVNDTEQRIADGNPMGIYGESTEVGMFFRITINNITVAFYAFVLGIFFSFGSYIILLTNGIMLGAFQWWFYGKGILLTSFLAVWIHGAFEISAIVIAGAAGITLGNGLLFPKTYSRLQSLIFSAKQGFIILMSLLPIFILAGALESFVTRYYQSIPSILNWLIIVGSFGIVILYYGILPFLVAKEYPDKLKLREIPRAFPQRSIKHHKIRTSGEVFSDAIYTIMQRAKTLISLSIKIVLPIVMLLVAVIGYFQYFDLSYSNDWLTNFDILFGVNNQFITYKFLGWSLALSATIVITIYSIKSSDKKTIKNHIQSHYQSFLWLFIFSAITMVGYLFLNWFLLILMLIFLGFIIQLVPVIILTEQVNLFTAMSRAFSIIKSGYAQSLSNSLAITAITVIFFFILHNPMGLGLMMLFNDFLENVLVGNVREAYLIINIFNIAVYVIFLIFIVQLYYINGYYFYHSQVEKEAATDLKDHISSVGKRSKIFETSIDFE